MFLKTIKTLSNTKTSFKAPATATFMSSDLANASNLHYNKIVHADPLIRKSLSILKDTCGSETPLKVP